MVTAIRDWLEMVISILIAAILFAKALYAMAPESMDEIYPWQESSWEEHEDQSEVQWNYEVNPLNINTATPEEITVLPGIQRSESDAIVKTRDETGLFKNADDLIKRTGISAEVIDRISGFLVFDQLPFEVRCHVKASRRFGKQADDDTQSFDGSPYTLTERMWVSTDKIRAGILFDKAKYEPSFDDQSRFFVFYKADALKLIAGDFNISSGFGLTLMTRPVFFDGFDSRTPYIIKLSDIAPAVETVENSAFRGIAAGYRVASLDINVFAARTELDAKVNSEGDVLYLSNGGLHRSEGEAEKNNTITETAIGGAVNYNIELDNDTRFMPFVTGYTAKLDPPLQPELTNRERFQLAGDRNGGYGAGCGFEKRNLSAGGEVGLDKDGDAAWKVVFSHRGIGSHKWIYRCTAYHYPAGYDNYRAGSPVAGSDPANRDGVAFMISGKCKLGIVKQLKSHIEIERRPWRTFTVPTPFTASKASFEAGCPFNDSELRIRFRRYNGHVGHGEEAAPTEFSDERLRLWWRNDFPELERIDYCRLWIEGAVRNDSENDKYYSSGGGVSIKGKLAMLGNWKAGYGVSCSVFSAQTVLPVYAGEADLPDRFASVRLSGEGVRWAGSLVLKRSRYNWFGLMAARTVQLGGNKGSGDTEAYATYSYNFKSGEGF